MGGRGASSGVSDNGNRYGTQYHTVFVSGNVKSVSKNSRESETLMETMTRGRVYAHVEGNDLKSIVYFDNAGRRSKQIDLGHAHLGASPHAHDGYYHSAFRKNLTTEERAMVDRVVNDWNNYKRKL